MEKVVLSTLPQLMEYQKSILRKGNVNTVTDLVLTPPQDLAKRCRVSTSEIVQLIQVICNNKGDMGFKFRTLDELKSKDKDEGKDEEVVFTLGDKVLDEVLDGGLRTGMVWEFVGESAAGKTQFALQSSLYVQLPKSQGGAEGSACYLTTKTSLQTARLLQILQNRKLNYPNPVPNSNSTPNTSSKPSSSSFLTSSVFLENIHTLSTPTVPILINILENQLPIFIQTNIQNPSRKPIKLLIIDALAELFHSHNKNSTSTLIERSKQLNQISTLLHNLANRYNIAILVLNEVNDVFERSVYDGENGENGFVGYSEQVRWFNRANSIYGENKKEASLGLVWANQVNVRVMLTRTGRRKYLGEDDETEEGDNGMEKRQRFGDHGHEHGSRGISNSNHRVELKNVERGEPTLIRRFTVVFSSVGTTDSCDYIVTQAGVKGIASEDKPMYGRPLVERNTCVSSGTQAQVQARPVLPVAQEVVQIKSLARQDSYDEYWTDNELYETIDWETLTQSKT